MNQESIVISQFSLIIWKKKLVAVWQVCVQGHYLASHLEDFYPWAMAQDVLPECLLHLLSMTR
jgi:hypothetical protein